MAVTLDETIAARLDSAADRFAGRVALVGEATSHTYGELLDLTHRVGHAILAAGVTAGDRVLLFFGHGPQSVVALLGTTRSGAVAVPVTVSVPRGRLAQILVDADPSCILTNAAHAGAARALGGGRFPVVDIDHLGAAPRQAWPARAATDPAFLLYTSGSTGQPKAVVHSHQSVLRKIDASHRAIQTAPGDRVGMFSSYAVGQGFTALFSALLHGGTLCPFDVRRFGFGPMSRWLVDQRISIYISSATLFRSLIRTLGDLRCPDLRLVRIGSERVTVDDVAAFRRLFGDHAQLLIAYSSTEASTIAMHFVGADEPLATGVVPVGTATDGLHVAVVDERGIAVPPGVEGEIVVTGTALPLGYWRDPDRTAQYYRRNPDRPDERIYHTGDLGRLRPDGLLEHLGRKDRRVKIRGFRIELEEIEIALARHPHVSRAAVLAPSDHQSDVTLVAYVELNASGGATKDDLRGFLAERLPEYMVPSRFVVLDALPVSDTGKVDRSQLPALREQSSTAVVGRPPTTPIEVVIGDVWKGVLGLESVGVDDQFLMVGGDSLRAGQIVARLSDALGVEILLWELLDRSTIRTLAELVADRLASSRGLADSADLTPASG